MSPEKGAVTFPNSLLLEWWVLPSPEPPACLLACVAPGHIVLQLSHLVLALPGQGQVWILPCTQQVLIKCLLHEGRGWLGHVQCKCPDACPASGARRESKEGTTKRSVVVDRTHCWK